MAATPELQSVALPDLFDLLRQPNPPLVCDARMGMLYRLGHIPGAISLPAGNWEEAFAAHRAELEAARAAGRRLVFYCVDPECPDARKTATWAARQGFSGVLVYEGGMQEWKEAGMPVE
jgi:rhodanese-related sulfurtransferase